MMFHDITGVSELVKCKATRANAKEVYFRK